MSEAEHYGWPVVRHMMLTYPNNTMMYTEDLQYQFMLGTELLVAPVHEHFEFLEERRVFLPENVTWVHVWTGTTYTGMVKCHSSTCVTYQAFARLNNLAILS